MNPWRSWGTSDPTWRKRGDDVVWMRSRGAQFKEIGEKLGVTGSRARQIYVRQLRFYRLTHKWLMLRVMRES